MNIFRSVPKVVLLLSFLLLVVSFCAGQTITGTVHNETTGRFSAGDQVILLRLDNGMLEETHTKTDAQGSFKLSVQFPGSRHVVRVFHQKVNYDQPVDSSAPLEIQVFDAKPKIKQIRESLGILKLEPGGKTLNVTELHAVDNDSKPPQTQASPNNFEISLPSDAQMDSVMAKGPGPNSIAVNITSTMVQNEAGHVTIRFPLRPGETQFAIRYHLPYQGKLTFHPRILYPTNSLGIMYPPSMEFSALKSDRFQWESDNGMQGQIVRNITPGEVLDFEVSGTGALSSRNPGATSPSAVSQPPASGGSRSDKAPAIQAQGKTPSSGKSILWLVVAGAFILFAAGVFLVWRMKAAKQQAAVEALKEKLFALENARLRGSISAEEYAASRKSLNQNLEQVVAKQDNKSKNLVTR